jgi:pimeloyl-ACP methyl ester carboxylesterase
MRDRVAELSDRYGRPMSLIGWSLGGIFARDIARRTPDSVRQVITLGSPFRLERASQTRATRVFDRYSHLHVEHRDFPLEADGVPMPVPATSIYSHFDGIVHWPACLNLPGERCENIAVYASHLGLGHHPAVLYAIADRLAQPEGSWEPFHPPLFLRPAYPHPDEVRPNTPLTGSAPAA